MKAYKIFFWASIIPIVLCTTSCKKTFFTDVNNNPNVISSVLPNLLLPTVEISLGYTVGGDFSRFSSLLTQQVVGSQNQSEQFYQYGVNAGTFDNAWADLYTSVMENNYALKQIADASGDNEYSGISRVIMAYSLMLAVDNWGKVPYSRALTGNQSSGTIYPTYDNDKALYDTISSLLKIGIAQISNSNQGGLVPSSTDDIIYGGDTSKWIKFAHAIKARLYIHQSKGNVAMADSALSEIALSFTSNTDNAQYIFGNTDPTANSWYQFGRDRAGYISFDTSTLAKNLIVLNDPRFSIYIDTVGGANSLGSFYGAINSPTEFITYDELLFMKAEATLTSGGTIANAQVLYQAAITANMTKLGVAGGDIASYITANGTLPNTTSAALAQVATQEYYALYLNPEAWVLYRRTGYPSLTPITGSNGIPRRLIYPQSEYSYNAANTPTSTLWSPRVFWDN